MMTFEHSFRAVRFIGQPCPRDMSQGPWEKRKVEINYALFAKDRSENKPVP